MSEEPESKETTRFFSTRKFIVVIVVLVVVAGTAGVLWWRQDHNFCDQVADLPDISRSIESSGSPSKGLLAYAAQLEKIASIAPDSATKSAAQTLADAQKAAGEALSGNTITSSAPSALAALDTSAISAAETQFQQTITSRCRS